MPWINKEDLTLKEFDSLQPTAWIVKGVNYKEVKYFKDDNDNVWEMGYCTDGSLSKRMEELKIAFKKKELMKNFGL